MSQVRNGRITLARTKNNKARAVPITAELQASIESHAEAHLPQMSGAIFGPCYSAFREGINRAGIVLPPGQLTHVLRHTFASHFMMNGGNILALQRILGHKDLKTTMRYAHLAPEHLESAKTLDPLSYHATVQPHPS
ncbi:site-specific tyrosine recombinase XerD [Castellaniella caeni]